VASDEHLNVFWTSSSPGGWSSRTFFSSSASAHEAASKTAAAIIEYIALFIELSLFYRVIALPVGDFALSISSGIKTQAPPLHPAGHR
jgi:hypothetical protein